MQLSFVKDLVASGAQLRTATGEERQGAFDQAAERVTNQGDRGATGKSVRSRGREWKKIGKSLNSRATQTEDPETSNFGGLSILCLGCS